MLCIIDGFVEEYHLGATTKVMKEHYGTVLPHINQNNEIMGGAVVYYEPSNMHVLQVESITDNLYNWYSYIYVEDPEVFFGEHLLCHDQVVVVRQELTALLGRLAMPQRDWLAVGEMGDLTPPMMEKLRGRQVALYPDDLCYDIWKKQFGTRYPIEDCNAPVD